MRTSPLLRSAALSEQPRYARVERCSRSASFQLSAKRSSWSSSQLSTRCSMSSLLLQQHEILRRVSSCSLRVELDKREARRKGRAQIRLRVIRAAEVRADDLCP